MKLFSGWVSEINQSVAVISTDHPGPFEPNEEFIITLASDERAAMVRAALKSSRPAQENIHESKINLTFGLEAEVKMLPPAEIPRFMVEHLRGVIETDYGVGEFRALNISGTGIGLETNAFLQAKTEAKLIVNTANGDINLKGEIRYVRKTEDDQFRAGILVEPTDRIGAMKWKRLVEDHGRNIPMRTSA